MHPTAHEHDYTAYDKSRKIRRPQRRHITLPSLQYKGKKNEITIRPKHPLEPRGPHRTADAGDANNPLGRSSLPTSECIHYHVDKPIVRTPRPQDYDKYLQLFKKPANVNNVSLYERLVLQRIWTTTTKEASDESAIPTTRPAMPNNTLEQHGPDPLTCRPPHNHYNPMLWQRMGRRWDAFQIREPVTPVRKQKNEFNLPKVSCLEIKDTDCDSNRCCQRCQSSDQLCDKCIAELYNKIHHWSVSGCGGAGCVTQYPVLVNTFTDDKCHNSSMCSTARQVYRRYPVHEYCNKSMEHFHKAPLSKLITLIAPHTPFSKRM